MLQFEEIKEDIMDKHTVESIGETEISVPKSFILAYTDNELTEKDIPEIWEKLSENDFKGEAENIDFIIYFNDLIGKSEIIMVLYYSEDYSGVLNVNEISKQYRLKFEDFYNINKPY